MVEEQKRDTLTFRFLNTVQISRDNRLDRFLVPVLLAIGILYSGIQVLAGDWVLAIVSGVSVVMLLALATVTPLQTIFLHRDFNRNHAFYIALFWLYSLLWVGLLRNLYAIPAFGKESQPFYVLLLLFFAITFRALLTIFALSWLGYRLFISEIPTWEKALVAINEFISAGLLAFFLGGELARFVQPTIFTVSVDVSYTLGVSLVLIAYYLIMQLMWIQSWNDRFSRSRIWVRWARIVTPFALIVATIVIGRHFARLSDPRTANLLGTADLDQTVLALSPIIWLMIFAVVLLVWTSGRGLRQRFIPNRLLERLPTRLNAFLSTISDMDILLIVGLLSTLIPLQIVLLDDGSTGVLDTLSQQIAQQNALIDSSDQALSVLFALPFYIVAVLLLSMYAYVMANPELSAKERDSLVDRLPIGLLIIFIITLYLCAIPFSQVLTEGRLPQLPQELGRLLAFDVLIPLVLLYFHYFVFIRIPYGRGQSRWRTQYSEYLESSLREVQRDIESVDKEVSRIEANWGRFGRFYDDSKRIETLYEFVELNGQRDRKNMELIRILNERQELAEVSETPVSVTIARLPTRIISIGIPLLIVFKVYEWAVVNDGLREIANNPNIGVIEFFQIILEQTQF